MAEAVDNGGLIGEVLHSAAAISGALGFACLDASTEGEPSLRSM